MQKVIVIYHANCDDGLGAAWCARRYFQYEPDINVRYIPADYKDTPPDVTGAVVYILDFSYAPDVVKEMAEKSSLLVLRDHHKSAMEKWTKGEKVEYPISIGGNGLVTFDMTRSGARLAWDYFFPGQEPPLLISHIEDNDLWKFKLSSTKPFIRALRSYPQTFEAFDMLNDVIEGSITGYNSIITDGTAIERYFNQQCEFILSVAPPCRVGIELDGKIEYGLGINAPKTFSSELGNILAERSGAYGLTWYMEGCNANVSLRSKGDYDVSKLAEVYGGGGHKNAAGFTVFGHEFISQIWDW
jgi:oligoribonuclease NrnB/cAMP/cGMP phosphodiesterase (DHH superfamily)